MDIILSLIITALSYGAGPLAIALFRKQPASKSGVRFFCGLYVVIVYIGYSALYIYLDAGIANSGAAIIWGFVFYKVSKRILQKKGLWGTVPEAFRVPASEVASPQIESQEVGQEPKLLFSSAYKSFASDTPEGQSFWRQVRGSSELKSAYLEEIENFKRNHDSGARINYKESYMEFMGVLHDDYFGGREQLGQQGEPVAEKQSATVVAQNSSGERKTIRLVKK